MKHISPPPMQTFHLDWRLLQKTSRKPFYETTMSETSLSVSILCTPQRILTWRHRHCFWLLVDVFDFEFHVGPTANYAWETISHSIWKNVHKQMLHGPQTVTVTIWVYILSTKRKRAQVMTVFSHTISIQFMLAPAVVLNICGCIITGKDVWLGPSVYYNIMLIRNTFIYFSTNLEPIVNIHSSVAAELKNWLAYWNVFSSIPGLHVDSTPFYCAAFPHEVWGKQVNLIKMENWIC